MAIDKTSKVWRVAGTRVSVDTVIIRYASGDSIETIASSFPLSVEQVANVIDYYKKNTDKVDQYLTLREKQREMLQDEIERKHQPNGSKYNLLSRLKTL